ncbi:TPA: pantetheine-phosphate adenylyltransferase [bacterium]|jgi:pantetheine-phosphate adenylyltransferase|nr:pantetheine-phosphate adenylyltransferase [bacterium]
MEKIAVYPGSFDPLTIGHLDIIERASRLFDHVYVTISLNKQKNIPLFSVEERTEFLKIATSYLDNVTIDHFEGLIVEYCLSKKARTIVKGIRNVIDLTSELSQFKFNYEISSLVDTIIMLPTAKNIFISSTTVKELLSFGGDITRYVPKLIHDKVVKCYKDKINNK